MDFTFIQTFLEQYGWFILLGLVFVYYVFPSLKSFTLKQFPTSKNSISQIPPSNDDRIAEARRKQQERYDRLTELANNGSNSNIVNNKKDKKLEKFKKTSAYVKATTGKWGSNKPKPGSMTDNSTYRPNPWKRNPKRGGGG